MWKTKKDMVRNVVGDMTELEIDIEDAQDRMKGRKIPIGKRTINP